MVSSLADRIDANSRLMKNCNRMRLQPQMARSSWYVRRLFASSALSAVSRGTDVGPTAGVGRMKHDNKPSALITSNVQKPGTLSNVQAKRVAIGSKTKTRSAGVLSDSKVIAAVKTGAR